MTPGTETAAHSFLRVAAHLAADRSASAAKIRELARRLLPEPWRGALESVSDEAINDLRRDRMANGDAYHALAGLLLQLILDRDGWKLSSVDQRGLASGRFTGKGPEWTRVSRPVSAEAAVFLAQRGERQLAIFFLDQGARKLRPAFERIAQADGDAYRLVALLVVPTREELDRVRNHRRADQYPRVFFTSFDQLRAAAAFVTPREYTELCGPVTAGVFLPANARPGNIAAFPAEVLANRPIGGPDGSHYVLTFKSSEIQEVWPSQFVMMDTGPVSNLLRPRVVSRGRLRGLVDLAPEPLLKRPFGVQRAYYHHFTRDHLRRLALPPSLALVLHPVYPHEFDLLYKVLPDGIGTPRMTGLRPGQRVHMLGPLGRPLDVRRLRGQGVDEVHVIGGGVGMAPLILLVQVLRYYSFRVKVFLGISRIGLLRYRGDVDPSFVEDPGEAYIYLDDVLEAGVPPADIFLSFDSERPERAVRRIPPENLYFGLVPEQYRQHLERDPDLAERARRGSVLAFTCGPNKMMEVVWDAARPAGVPVQVLMEKRMACGMGVCLSCVCKVRRADGSEDYARVCTEGPVFDAGEILWNDNHSKSASAPCGSVRPC